MKFTLLKTCIRGKAGDVVNVHDDDVLALCHNGVIDQSENDKKSHTAKAEVKAPKAKKAK